MADFWLDASFPVPWTLRLSLTGFLDAEGSRVLLHTAATAAHQVDGIELDLGGLTGFTVDGARALAACRSLALLMADGVVVHTHGGPGRDLLVASRALAS